MKRVLILLVTAALTFALVGCGMKNDTPLNAAKSFMQTVVEGDVEANAELNKSNALSYPPDHIINLANKYDLVGKDLDYFTFKEHENNEKAIIVSWTNEDGEERDWKLYFIKTSEGYFFNDLD